MKIVVRCIPGKAAGASHTYQLSHNDRIHAVYATASRASEDALAVAGERGGEVWFEDCDDGGHPMEPRRLWSQSESSVRKPT